MRSLRFTAIVALSAAMALAGCAMPDVFKFSKDDVPKAGPRNPVIRILGMWEPAEGMLQGKSTRGFSSHVMFFSQNSDLAAEVDGDLVIYVFDDQGTKEEQAIPFEEYRIKADALASHMGKGPLGATYCVFVPYNKPGFHEAKCALRLRLTPKGGQPVYSDMMNVTLPGEKKSKVDPAEEEGDNTTTEAILEVDPDGEAFSAFRNKVSRQQHPLARGTATTIPTPKEVQEQLQAQHRIRATELDAKERRRLMREATARLEAEKGASRVVLAGYEESEAENVAAEVADELDSASQNLEKTDENADEELPSAVTRRAKPAKRHLLDDDE